MLCVDKTPGTELLQPIAFSGDDGLTLIERASYGVIGSITPTTNPTETIINNGIGMVAGGNAVVFNAHPYAARTSAFLIHQLQRRDRGGGRAGEPARLRRAADDRERRGADAAIRACACWSSRAGPASSRRRWAAARR